MRPLRVCMIGPYFPPDIGASSTQMWNIGRGLIDRGVAVTMLTAYPHYPSGKIPRGYLSKFFVRERVHGIDVVRVWVPPLASKGFLRRALIFSFFASASAFMMPLIRGANVLFATGPWAPSPFTIPALVYSKISGKKLVLYEVDSIPDILFGLKVVTGRQTQKILKVVGRRIELASDAVVTYTHSIAAMIRRRGVAARKVFTIPLPVDTQVFNPANRKAELRSLGIPPGALIVAYSGILGPFYDFDTLLYAANELRKVPDVFFLVRGDGEMKKHLKNAIAQLELHNVKLLTRREDFPDVAGILNSSDILVVPMRYFPIWSEIVIPTKIGEYMACGKPIVACAVGETERLFREEGVGFCVPPGNPGALAKTILDLKENPKLRSQMGETARRVASESFSIGKVCDRLVSIFRNMIEVKEEVRTS